VLSRRTLLTIGLLGAGLGPILVTSSDGIFGSAAKAFKSMTGDSGSEPALNLSPPPKYSAVPWGAGTGQPTGSASFGASQLPVSLTDVLRFDIAPAWIMARWPHVLTMADSGKLQGYRVPLVTGTGEHDVAGTLTYYYSPRPELQRIRLTGVMGDPSQLVALVTSRFGFQKQISPDAGAHVYQIVYGKRPNSQLLIRMQDVIRNDRPLRRFDIDLEINLPHVPPSTLLVGQTPPPPPAPPRPAAKK
jgi:hypothetical protein